MNHASSLDIAVPRPDFTSPRLFVDVALVPGTTVALERDQAHYLGHVLRLAAGASVLVFNGREGEWQARFSGGKARQTVLVGHQTRPQTRPGDLVYCFAPLKHARLDYMVQKAVEMGVDALQPVMTRRTQASRVNTDRMRANAVEAAEQCGVLRVPEICAPLGLSDLIAAWPPDRLMIFCDEDVETADPVAALDAVAPASKLGVIIGPEGGFDESERTALLALPYRVRLSLGPRILRADTAAVAALALIQSVLGDGRPQV